MVTRSHSLSLVVPLVVIPYHSLSLVATRCHLLSLVVPLVVTRCTTRCHSLPLVVILCHLLYHSLSLDVPLVCLFINDRRNHLFMELRSVVFELKDQNLFLRRCLFKFGATDRRRTYIYLSFYKRSKKPPLQGVMQCGI